VTAPWTRRHWVTLLALLALGVGLGWRDRTPEIGVGGDEATYLILSQSLERGEFRDEDLVGSPPHAKYPPGYPVFLLGLHLVLGRGLDTAIAANLLLLALTAVLIGDGVRRLSGPWPGVGAAAAVVLSPTSLVTSGTVLSEALYVALATFAVWALLRAGRDPGVRWPLVALAAGLGAFFTRSAGVAVLGAIIAWCLLQRRWRMAAGAGVAGGAAVGGWFAYVRWSAGIGAERSYANDMVAEAGEVASGPVARLMDNGAAYLLHLPPSLGLPSAPGILIDNLGWGVLLLACGGFGAWALWKTWPAAFASLALHLGIVVAWPWFVPRLIVPLLPLTIAVLILGAHHGAAVLGRRGRAAATTAVIGLLLAAALTAHLRTAKFHSCDREDPYADPACFIPKERAMAMATRAIRDSTPADAVVVTGKPSTVYHFSGRKAVGFTILPDPSAIPPAATLDSFGFTNLLLDALLPEYWRRIAPTLQERCHGLRVVAAFEPATLLLGFRAEDDPGPDACQALPLQLEASRTVLRGTP
jgi:4-amino-4-deoxy-L-arabinose transferase-like glycosyltransferase